MSHQDYQWGPPPRPNNSNATVALVLGICGMFLCPLICSILAIVFAKTAYREIDASGGYQGGRGNAQAGLILGWVGLAIWGVFILIYVAIFVIMLGLLAHDGNFDTITLVLAR